MTPMEEVTMVAGLVPPASGLKKSTSMGAAVGEKNSSGPGMLPQPCILVEIPRLRVSESSLTTSMLQLPPESMSRCEMSKQYSVCDEYSPSQGFCSF